MNENVKKWVDVLRSGKYKQGRLYLRRADNDRFCCLGVACDLYRKETGEGEWILGTQSYYVFENENGNATNVLPSKVKKWLGLSTKGGRYGYRRGSADGSSLYECNDTGKSFLEIADIVESKPEGLFDDE